MHVLHITYSISEVDGLWKRQTAPAACTKKTKTYVLYCTVLYWSLLYSAILRSWADSLRSHVILHEWIAFYSAFLNIHRSGVLTALAWLVPQESAARESQSRRVLCTPYNHAPCHFMQSHIRKVYACLAVTCHLRFWQNDRGLLRATAVTRGWNGCRNKSMWLRILVFGEFLVVWQCHRTQGAPRWHQFVTSHVAKKRMFYVLLFGRHKQTSWDSATESERQY